MPAAPAAIFAVRTAAADRILASRVRTARSLWARFRGLMGRAGLEDGEGLWFPGDSSIHMFFMRFPIDAVFLAAAGEAGTWRVVGLREGLRPWRDLAWERGADGCLELAAGAARAAGVGPGDLVHFGPP